MIVKVKLIFILVIFYCFGSVHLETNQNSKDIEINQTNDEFALATIDRDVNPNFEYESTERFDASRDVGIYYYDCDHLTNRRSYNSSAGTRIYMSEPHLLRNTSFDRNKPTRILIHGWLADRSSPFFDRIVEGYLRDSCLSRLTNDFNLILIDWSAGSQARYNNAKQCIPSTGKFVARLLDYLAREFLVDMDDVTLVGFSMGAHIAGYAGKNVQTGKIGVIVGLDPAGRGFRNETTEKKLTPTDATYVEVVHTNAGGLDDLPRRWGIDQPLGHADFYPNGGGFQGCLGGCAHYRAIRYFAESLTPHTAGFLGTDCNDYKLLVRERECISKTGQIAQMGGEPSMRHQRGIYYLTTRYTTPYGRGIFGFLYTNDIRKKKANSKNHKYN